MAVLRILYRYAPYVSWQHIFQGRSVWTESKCWYSVQRIAGSCSQQPFSWLLSGSLSYCIYYRWLGIILCDDLVGGTVASIASCRCTIALIPTHEKRDNSWKKQGNSNKILRANEWIVVPVARSVESGFEVWKSPVWKNFKWSVWHCEN